MIPRPTLALATAFVLAPAAPPASAAEPPDLAPSGIPIALADAVDGLAWTIGVKSATAGFVTGNTNFGAGRIESGGQQHGRHVLVRRLRAAGHAPGLRRARLRDLLRHRRRRVHAHPRRGRRRRLHEQPEPGRRRRRALGLTYVRVIDSDEIFKIRKGMNAINVWANNVRILEGVRGAPDLFLWGGYAREWGGENVDIDASAWYVELGTRLQRLLPGAPSLRYRYSRFSGDDDPSDGKARGYDPLYYGFTPNRGAPYGTWYQGEIVGEYLIFKTNLRAHMLHLDFWLAPGTRGKELSLGLIYYRFRLDAKQYKGTPVTSRDFAQELDAVALWRRTFFGRLYVELSTVFGAAWPGAAARQSFAGGDPYWLFEAYAFVQF